MIAEWQTTPPPARRRRDPANILTKAAAVRGRARNVRSEAEAFKLFITDAIIEKIVAHTNDRLPQERQRFEAACSASTTEKTAHRLQDVTHTEICAFLGLCILRGFYSRLTLRELFNTATGPAIFKATMGRKWFSKLLQFVSFDDLNTREDRRPRDKFCHLREIFNEIDQNLRRHLSGRKSVSVWTKVWCGSGAGAYSKSTCPASRESTACLYEQWRTQITATCTRCGRTLAGRRLPSWHLLAHSSSQCHRW